MSYILLYISGYGAMWYPVCIATESFVLAWNEHPVQTECNWSPIQMWTNWTVDIRNCGCSGSAEEVQDLEWYSSDSDAPTPSDDGMFTVEVDDIPLPYLELDDLAHQINPLAYSVLVLIFMSKHFL